MSGTFVPNGNKNLQVKQNRPTQPKNVQEFGTLLATALGATLEQLQSGDGVPVLELMTAVPRSMRLEYIELRRNGAHHKAAVQEINRRWSNSK